MGERPSGHFCAPLGVGSVKRTQKAKKVELTPGEMEILGLLWDHGALTIAETHKAFPRKIGYTTIQTRLNRLVEKGLVQRSADRPASYAAAITRDDISAGHLDTLLERVVGGNVVPLVAYLVQDRKLSADEIDQLKQLIREAELDQREKGGEQ